MPWTTDVANSRIEDGNETLTPWVPPEAETGWRDKAASAVRKAAAAAERRQRRHWTTILYLWLDAVILLPVLFILSGYELLFVFVVLKRLFAYLGG